MAVYNDYVDTQILAGRYTSAQASGGGKIVKVIAVFDTTAAHDAGSIYRVVKNVPSSAIPLSLAIATDGVTGMNDVNVGLFKPYAGGDEVGTEVLASALDLSSAVSFSTAAAGIGNGMGNIALADYGKQLWELAGQTITSKQSHYDIALTSVADLSEADSIAVIFEYSIN